MVWMSVIRVTESDNDGIISTDEMSASVGIVATIGSDTAVPCSMFWMSVACLTKMGDGGMIFIEGMSASVGCAGTIGSKTLALGEVIQA